jgi:hypothetical protein
MSTWVTEYSHGAEYVENLDGVSWADAPRPRWWHRCRAQTTAMLDRAFISRCACGASRVNGGWWYGRNSRG